ncbi:putative reverse transcriptase domain-containing protein [Tanacetum coccineum]|uniref:Reverse transcriptase domain-containing protein n=1 Tax=Tanacetum coccineum TaxID=301880 RepID=A0ABQ5BE12_9ASTR
MLTDFISIISFTFESNYLISSLESSNGEPSLVSTTSIPTPPPSPLITRQRHANLCNNKGTVDNIISQLGFAFALKDLGPLNYFLGTEIVPHVSGILLSQKKYILELLQSDDLSNCKPVSSPMVCQYIHASIENHWSAVKRILRYLYGNPDTSLEALSDADWAGDSDDRRSTRGFSIYLALADTVVELTWLQALLYELGIRSSSTPILWCDNLGATYLSANPIFRVRTKHIEIDYTLFGKRFPMSPTAVLFDVNIRRISIHHYGMVEMDDLPVGLANAAESVRDTIGFNYHLSIRSAPFEAFYGRKCRSSILWAEIGESSLTGLELVQETTDKVVLVNEKPKAARDHQKSDVDYRRKPLEFEVGNRVLLTVTPWKGVVRFGKKGKLAPRYVGPFKILERIGLVAYRLRLPEELNSVHHTFHVSNQKKCLADVNLHVPLDEIKVDTTLRFVEKPVEIMDREIKKLKRSKIALVKVRWNSKHGPEFNWEHEDQMRIKYPQFFVDRVVEPASTSNQELSKSKFVIVCHEKVVRIPLEGEEILRVQGERTLGAAKALMNAKIDEPRIIDIPVVRDLTDVSPEDLLGLPPQRQVEFRIDLVPGATSVAKSSYRLAPSEMQELSEQLQELEDKGSI